MIGKVPLGSTGVSMSPTGARIAFITPHQLENLGAPLPDHKQQNENIYIYTDAITKVAKGKGPAPGASRVERLRGDDYVRVWINRGGNHYLIHLVAG